MLGDGRSWVLAIVPAKSASDVKWVTKQLKELGFYAVMVEKCRSFARLEVLVKGNTPASAWPGPYPPEYEVTGLVQQCELEAHPERLIQLVCRVGAIRIGYDPVL